MSEQPEDLGAPTPAGDPLSPAPRPGAGQPLVGGPPHSVRSPVGAGAINTGFGVAAIIGIVVAVVVVGALVAFLLHH